MSRAYDPANRVQTHTFEDGNVMEWVYDNRNVVTEVKYDGDSVLNQIHDPGYRCTNQSFGNGLDRTIAFGRQDNLRTNDKVEDTGIIDDLNLDYTYAADKNVLSETSPNGVLADLSFTAAYDPGNRVASWARADQYPGARETQSWNYDDAGNWNSTTIDGNVQNRTNNSSDEATEIDGDPLSYDSRGNLTEDETGQTYKWDIDNRLKQVDGAGDRIYYKYDVFGRRVYQKKGTDKEALLWWGKEESAEHRQIASKPVIQNDLHAHPNGLNTTFGRALEGDKNDIQYFHKNYLDHVYAVSDDNGNVIEQYRYSAFGEVEVFDGTGLSIASTAIENDILWNVKRVDWDTGLYMYLYRHYDPEHGRWLSRDPIEENGGRNLYRIVGNNGILLYDVVGLIDLSTPRINHPHNRRNRRRITNGSAFDTRGKELFDHGLNGKGKLFNRTGGAWGKYMKAHDGLRAEIINGMWDELTNRTASGGFNLSFHADLGDEYNGYFTGYQLLHGTNAHVGDFQITGYAQVTNTGTSHGTSQIIKYTAMEYTWNDMGDVNHQYLLDELYFWLIDLFYEPKEYQIRIKWGGDFQVCKANGRIISIKGYPFTDESE